MTKAFQKFREVIVSQVPIRIGLSWCLHNSDVIRRVLWRLCSLMTGAGVKPLSGRGVR